MVSSLLETKLRLRTCACWSCLVSKHQNHLMQKTLQQKAVHQPVVRFCTNSPLSHCSDIMTCRALTTRRDGRTREDGHHHPPERCSNCASSKTSCWEHLG